MKKLNEIWKSVPGYSGYLASSRGRIMALRRPCSAGGVMKLKKHCGRNEGYMIVNLCLDGLCVSKQVHRLVAKAFIPNPQEKPIINHKNRNRADNRVENLEWVTAAENIRHAIALGSFDFIRSNAKLDWQKVRKIRKIYTGQRGEQTKLARSYGVSRQVIGDILAGVSWKVA